MNKESIDKSIKDNKAPVKEAKAADDVKKKSTVDENLVKEEKVSKKKKVKKRVAYGQVHILATFNNTIISVTDNKGNLLTNASAGGCGFRGSKKGTAYAAQVAADQAISDARQLYGFSKADIFVKGIGLGRDAAIRSLASNNILIESICDVTGIAHGGCRPRKARRV